MTNPPVAKPWYREPWCWLVLAPLLLAVLGSIFAGVLAYKGADDRVVDDYYRVGKGINNQFEADKRAVALGLTAEVVFDTQTGEVWLSLQGLPDTQTPLDLVLSHPFKAALDQTLRLKPVSQGRYRADLANLALGRWYLSLSPAVLDDAHGWRLLGEINLQNTQTVKLLPQVR